MGETASMLHGGRIVARALMAEGIDHVFTLCGRHVQHIYDGCMDEGIRIVDVRHEQTAGHAADAYARVTGKPGVVIVTAGPGVTDVVTAVANARRAGVPMICIGGACPIPRRHMGSLQDMDHVELMSSITKWSASVAETRRLPEYVATAFRHATSGVPGPVFLEIPQDVLATTLSEDQLIRPTGYRTHYRPAPDTSAVQKAAALLEGAARPVAVLGSELRWSADPEALSRFVERFELPVYLTGMARGALPPDHPCLLFRSRRAALSEADVVLVVGTPFDFRLDYGRTGPWAADARIVQVDLDPSQIGRNRGVEVGIPADPGLTLTALGGRLRGSRDGGWLATMRGLEEEQLAPLRKEMKSADSPPNPLRVCAELARYVDDDTIVIGDGGDFVALAAHALPVRWPGLWLDAGPLGTLGVGPGYAMAAKLVRPQSKVLVLFGDGSFGLHAMEWEALARHGIKVVGVVGNNAEWSQVRRIQGETFGAERCVATKLDYTRYDRIVDACGGRGFYVETLEQLNQALEQAFACDYPALVNVKIGASAFHEDPFAI